jgi:hypothetical protein
LLTVGLSPPTEKQAIQFISNWCYGEQLALCATEGQSVGTSGIIIGFLIFASCRYKGDGIEDQVVGARGTHMAA